MIQLQFKNLTFFIFRIELNDPATAATFIELQEKIERLCKLTIFSFIKVTAPMFSIPTLLATISNYFMLNMGEESFLLPSPISYVVFSSNRCCINHFKFNKSLLFFKITIQYKELARILFRVSSRICWIICSVCCVC